MKNAPTDYQCPFCHLADTLSRQALEPEIILVEPRVFAFVPLHHYAGIRGNCLVVPRAHYENVLDIPDELGGDFFRAQDHIGLDITTAGCDRSSRHLL